MARELASDDAVKLFINGPAGPTGLLAGVLSPGASRGGRTPSANTVTGVSRPGTSRPQPPPVRPRRARRTR